MSLLFQWSKELDANIYPVILKAFEIKNWRCKTHYPNYFQNWFLIYSDKLKLLKDAHQMILPININTYDFNFVILSLWLYTLLRLNLCNSMLHNTFYTKIPFSLNSWSYVINMSLGAAYVCTAMHIQFLWLDSVFDVEWTWLREFKKGHFTVKW